jgi:hypothetical protein
LAPKPTTHIPDDEAAGKLRAYAISLNDLCAGAAFSAARASNAGDYRLGTLGAAIYKGSALIAWAHATTRNCTTFGLDAVLLVVLHCHLRLGIGLERSLASHWNMKERCHMCYIRVYKVVKFSAVKYVSCFLREAGAFQRKGAL